VRFYRIPYVVIESHGKTIPSVVIPKLFDVFYDFSIGEAAISGRGHGLGPASACRILSLFGASVSIAYFELSGMRITILLKIATLNGSIRASSRLARRKVVPGYPGARSRDIDLLLKLLAFCGAPQPTCFT
jgi:hypothetical protein